MKCHACNLSGICKMFQMINDFKSTMNVSVDSCSLFQGGAAPAVSPTEPAKLGSLQSETQKSRVNINDISRMIKSMNEETNNDEVIIEALPAIDISPTCHACKSDSSDMVQCASCKGNFCLDCTVENASTGLAYCEPCYDELP